jgi:hypothetical protein
VLRAVVRLREAVLRDEVVFFAALLRAEVLRGELVFFAELAREDEPLRDEVPPRAEVLRADVPLRDAVVRDDERLREEAELDAGFLAPRLEPAADFADFTGRAFDVAFLAGALAFTFLTFARFPGIADPLFRDFLDRVTDVLLVAFAGNIGLGENSNQPTVFDDRQTANLVLRHQLECLVEVAVGLDCDRVGRRNLAHWRRLRVLSLGDHADRDVAIGHRAEQVPVVHHRDHPCVSVFHQLGRL